MSDKRYSIQLFWPIVISIIFMVLKLCGVIGWSWWWVSCPVWSTLLVGVFMIVYLEMKNEKL